jgi:hypothetical protein
MHGIPAGYCERRRNNERQQQREVIGYGLLSANNLVELRSTGRTNASAPT